jgi:formylglycine-generating enzyme required for sulfatase activity
MCYVPPGSFQRDGTATNISVITKGYWMGETEVTVELGRVMGWNLDSGYQAKWPLDNVGMIDSDGTWIRVLERCNKLSQLTGRTPVYNISAKYDSEGYPNGEYTVKLVAGANGFRVPTEMEWMWAAMGADTTEQPNRTGYKKGYPGSTGTSTAGMTDYGWYKDNSGSSTGGSIHKTVATKKPNELGLYDMLGNVWEYCLTHRGNYNAMQAYPTGTVTDFPGNTYNLGVIARGGGCLHSGLNRITVRENGYNQNQGFRIVLPFN